LAEISKKMWKEALQQIPKVQKKEEWQKLGIVTRWLIATRAAVFVITILSALIV
jgi:1,4-dihydroxy-2-naphthoate octaprenyltransferase